MFYACTSSAGDLFSSIDAIVDSTSRIISTVSPEDEAKKKPEAISGNENLSDEELLAKKRQQDSEISKLSKANQKLVQICKEYKKNSIKADKRYLGTTVSAQGRYNFSTEFMPYQEVKFSYYDGVLNAEYSIFASGKIIHPDWDNDQNHTLSGKLERITTELTGCSFKIRNAR